MGNKKMKRIGLMGRKGGSVLKGRPVSVSGGENGVKREFKRALLYATKEERSHD